MRRAPAAVPRLRSTLANPSVLAARIAARDAVEMQPLNRFAASLRERHGAVPDFDPLDGGTTARLLLVLETPGPGMAPTRFVSRDNPTGTAANLRRFFDAAGIARRDSVIWNAVPWIIHAPRARNRAPRRAEIALGLVALPLLLDLLPRLAVVVLAGRVAAEAEGQIAMNRQGLPVLLMPHPSPHTRVHQRGDPEKNRGCPGQGCGPRCRRVVRCVGSTLKLSATSDTARRLGDGADRWVIQ